MSSLSDGRDSFYDPIHLSKEIVERYQRYLLTTFYFKDRTLRDSFLQALSKGHLNKGPYVEGAPVIKRGKTMRQLTAELIDQPIEAEFLQAISGDRPLYFHQEEAVQRVSVLQRNVVVTTGTASGKTEAFLYPILLHLLKEHQNGTLGHGVRAVILYPMNALANDQRERLGAICKALEKHNSSFDFTFGQYTGETPWNEKDGQHYAQTRIENRLPGELVLRKEMWITPPHILLTNYPMLEYLLIRPDDSPLFDNGKAKWWTFLVLDEAHQYRGTKGMEMGMLLRRLKSRLREGGRELPFRCIATSATIAGGPKDRTKVAAFASRLFGELFEEEDIILGKYEEIPHPKATKLLPIQYQKLYGALDKNSLEEIPEIASHLGVNVRQGLGIQYVVGDILEHDGRSQKLRYILSKSAKLASVLSNDLFSDLPEEERLPLLSMLIELLMRSRSPRSDAPLISVRYHLFLRSLEGAFIFYSPKKKILLSRQGRKGKGALFEIALCRECGQHYLVGRIDQKTLKEAIRDPGHIKFGATFFRPLEDEESLPETKEKKSIHSLCLECGTIADEKENVCAECRHSNFLLIEEEESAKEKEDQIPRCSACGYTSPDPVREIIHGTDGPHAVIVTTLHKSLPSERRKVLTFSDGRQQAAFFAWYLGKSYEDILNRNLLLKALRRLSLHTREGVSLRELASCLFRVSMENNRFPASHGTIENRKRIWKGIYREFLGEEQRISLEGVGLLRLTIKWPTEKKIFAALLPFLESLLNTHKEDALDLLHMLLDSLRYDKSIAICANGGVTLDWHDLNLQAVQTVVRIGHPRGQKNVKSWEGAKGRRALLLRKILRRKGYSEEMGIQKTEEILRVVWQKLKEANYLLPPDQRILLSKQANGGYRINPDWWRVFPTSNKDTLFQCDRCNRLQSVHAFGVCVRHRCSGTVYPIMRGNLEENHYRLLYEENLPLKMKVEEHTAQIDKQKARDFQRKFRRGEIHVLSSSTTFEVGVDLGDLDVIFLRNVPPETFNYTQRVGRAGRRGDIPGFAITFCRRNSHDLYHYAEPEKRVLKGATRTPIFSLNNKKILKRHMAATALSYFFRAYPKRFENVEAFFKDFYNPKGCNDFYLFLKQERKKIERSLHAIIPSEMNKEVELDREDYWIEKIAGRESSLSLAEAEVCEDYKGVQQFKKQALIEEVGRIIDWAKRRAKTIAGEDILSFLSRKVIIPKYGFPVDVVELDTHRIKNSDTASVLLQRDLTLAIAEFAPTSKLVANKREWISYGLKRVPEKEWPRFYYKLCPKHTLFVRWKAEDKQPEKSCCKDMINGQYINPLFGFVTNREEATPPKRSTPRLFTTRPYFIGLVTEKSKEINFETFILSKTSPGRMVVLCEGRRGEGFYVCGKCGAGLRQRKSKHKTPYGSPCNGTLEQVSIGHEFQTDVIMFRFLAPPPKEVKQKGFSFAHSLAYALVEGAAEILEVPLTDLSATVSYQVESLIPPIVLYDNVPGGAGLVAHLEDQQTLSNCFRAAIKRVSGSCGCGEETSCYGCLRNYRNQFAHPYLRRGYARQYLSMLLEHLM